MSVVSSSMESIKEPLSQVKITVSLTVRRYRLVGEWQKFNVFSKLGQFLWLAVTNSELSNHSAG